MKYLIDSDWIVDCLNGDQPSARSLLGIAGEGLAVSIISVAEIYEGAFGKPDPEEHLRSFRRFLGAFTVLTIDDRIAERFAALRSELRHAGRRVADFDLLIASTALEFGLLLGTRNTRHFARIPGLALHQP